MSRLTPHEIFPISRRMFQPPMSSSKLPRGDKPEDRSVTVTDSTASAFAACSQPHGHILPHPNMHPHSSKSARPIAPAPMMSGSSGTTTLSTPGNIPNFISPDSFRTALVTKTSDSRHGSQVSAGMTSSPAHAALSLPGTLAQSSIVQIGGASSAALTTAASAITPNQLAASTLRGPVQPQLAAFSTHIPTGALVASKLVMRPSQPTAMASASSHLVVGRQQAVMPAIKAGSPANTRASSPVISIPGPQIPASTEQLRSSMALPGTAAQGGPIQITLRQTAAEGKSNLTQPPQKIIVTQPPKVVAPLIPHTVINANKSVGFAVSAQTPAGAIVATASTLASVTTTGSSTIPVAKVPPQRQQMSASTLATSVAVSMGASEMVRSEAVSTGSYQTMSSILMQPSRPINATTSVTTTLTVPTSVSQTEVRPDSQRPNNIPQLPPFNSMNPESRWLYTPQYPVLYPHPHIAQAQVQVTTQAGAAPLVQPITAATTLTQNLSTIIFPKAPVESTVQNQGPTLTAALAAGLQPQSHGMSLAGPQQMRLVAVDPRQPMAVHQLSTATPASIVSSAGLVEPKPIISLTASPRGGTLLQGPGGEMVSLGITSLPSTATVASSIYTCSNNSQAQPPVSSSGPSNPTASPRPSILRKRFSDGTAVIPKRPNFSMTNESHSPRPENASVSNASSPKTPAGDNSQSSTDTALSTEGQPTTNSHSEVRVKHEVHEALENGPTASSSGGSITSAVVNNSNAVEESPRKRPRKQLLHINEELKDHTSSDEDMDVKLLDGREEAAHSHKPEVRDEYFDDEGVRYVNKSPNPKVGLLNFYNPTWKPRNNHFVRITEVKKKDERRPTVNELANKRGILQKSSGWKIYCLSAQLEHYVDYEKVYCEKLCDLQSLLTPKQSSKQNLDDDSSSLYESTQACIQRSKLLIDQTGETIHNMMQILEHKPPITEIIHKHMSKRPIKKKERS